MFDKILIANRGEIACRVAATARRLGVRTVAVYADTDVHALHVQACDEAVALGGVTASESYLRWDAILQAARDTGAQAVHPGYGFLSENADFAQACAAAGIVFIGPPPQAIRDMGSKSAAKARMALAGVPLVPGYHGDDNDPALLKREALRIGFPVLIKASAGGGGKGMRRVDAEADFDAALSACQREARASFGNDHVLVERYVTRPRHIEIQVFADTQGHCVYLFERDCSVQRRHQKVLEEAPAPGLSAARRAEMGAAAVAAAQAVGYVGAGTVEFIAEPAADGSDLRFYFMEMNTRLQVEHPVTEAITGLDLVAWQLRVAAGEPLPLTQAQLRCDGHAIEARICAENPDAGFLPATGRLDALHWPAHVRFERGGTPDAAAAVRIDAGVVQGDAISPHFDSMIAKLIVWGADRAQALSRLDAALAATRIAGLHTNVAFLRRVVRSTAFATADLDTALIERERAALFDLPGLPLEWAAAGMVAHTLAAERGTEGVDPWSKRDGWRLHGGAERHFELEVSGVRQRAVLQRTHRSRADAGLLLRIDGADGGADGGGWVLTLRPLSGAADAKDSGHDVQLGALRRVLHTHASGEQVAVFAPEGSAVVRLVDPLADAGAGAAAEGSLAAPMPGKVVSFLVAAGAAVTRGQPLAVMEAMKMEHTLAAPRDGVVEELLFAVGDQVAEGQALLRLQAA